MSQSPKVQVRHVYSSSNKVVERFGNIFSSFAYQLVRDMKLPNELKILELLSHFAFLGNVSSNLSTRTKILRLSNWQTEAGKLNSFKIRHNVFSFLL